MLSQNNNSSVISSVGDEIALKKLILSAKKGDSHSFELVYTALFTPLYRYVRSRVSDTDLVNDICQQTFLKFYEALPTYKPEKSPLAYLFTIAKNLLINHTIKKTFVPFDDFFQETHEDESVNIVDEIHLQRLASSINEYLPSLTQDEQDVIRMYFYSELSYKEISEILDKEESYLRKIKERALKKLRILTQHLNEEN
ncbi:MAG: sigma-70 family RNA polymerase sigma factor [Candidatus Pacebacteria bacterium]|nr:sigma-70 family RNA polymerase sigma factor [Candidatus Paceibacterota bacterium]MBP9867022.1 sigma-70 family RNA polymerase sigma factor [Candidatus Paceibacterota bacterium]